MPVFWKRKTQKCTNILVLSNYINKRMHRIHLNRTSLTLTIWWQYPWLPVCIPECWWLPWLSDLYAGQSQTIMIDPRHTLSDDKMDWHLTRILLGVFFYVLFQLYRSDITTIDVLVKEAFLILRVENEFSSKLDFD